MPWQQDRRIEDFQVFYSAFQLIVIAGGQMEPPNHCMEGRFIRMIVISLLRSINHSCMTATSEENDSFI